MCHLNFERNFTQQDHNWSWRDPLFFEGCSSLSWLLIKVWLAPSRLCPLFPCQQKGMLEENLDLWQWFCSFSVTHIYTPDDVNIDFQWWLSFPSFLAVNKCWSVLLKNNQIKILKRYSFKIIFVIHYNFICFWILRTLTYSVDINKYIWILGQFVHS